MPGFCNCCCKCACIATHLTWMADKFQRVYDENQELKISGCQCACHKNRLAERRKHYQSSDQYFESPTSGRYLGEMYRFDKCPCGTHSIRTRIPPMRRSIYTVRPDFHVYGFGRFGEFSPVIESENVSKSNNIDETDINQVSIKGEEPLHLGGTRYRKRKIEIESDPVTGIVHKRQTIKQTIEPHSLLDSTRTRTNVINTYYDPATGVTHKHHTIHKKHHDDGLFSNGGAQQKHIINSFTDHLTGQHHQQHHTSRKGDDYQTVHITKRIPKSVWF